MKLHALAQTWEALRETRSRLKKVDAVSGLLATVNGSDVASVVTMLSGELPQGRIGMGYAAVGATEAAAADEPTVTLHDVNATLTAIKETSGAGSKAAKQALLADLLRQSTPVEQEFLRRLLVGELRQGALEGIMADAIADAANVPAPLVRRAAMVSGDLAAIAATALTRGAEGLAEFGLQLFTPLQPMLAQTSESVDAGLERLGRAGIEWKVDGARVQVHRQGDQVQIFTRNLRDITASSPDVVRIAKSLHVESVILDGEAVFFDNDRPVAFQDTISRFSTEADGSLGAVFFDCLHLDGVDLIDEPSSVRWEALRRCVPDAMRVARLETDSAVDGQAFFDQAIDAGYEGVMIKALDGTYEAGRRGAGWLKVKPVHTLDLVVLAVEWGSGRRKGWLSNIHLGARDPDTPGRFVMLGKTFKGMTDDMLAWQTERFLELEERRDRHIVYVRPEQVVEVAIDGVQRSSRYPGGVALRFARVKQYRDDKSPDEADTLATVRSLHK